MLHLPKPSTEDLDEYFDSFSDKIKESVAESPVREVLKNFLTNDKLKEIICADVNMLLMHHDSILQNLIVDFDANEYDQYFSIRTLDENDRTNNQRDIINKYDEIFKLEEIFDYERFISGSKSRSYDLASRLNRNTCTYCNRLYTTTIVSKRNDKGRITRPYFDHWFPKSKYPGLALSYHNLIPSCSICNSGIKFSHPFSLDTHIHPYVDNILSHRIFSYTYDELGELAVLVKATGNGKLDRTLADFKIEAVYNGHSQFELKDLYDLRYKYTTNYIKTLLNDTFKEMNQSDHEIYRWVFGVEFDEDNFHKRPFSKFKRDIIDELNESENI